LAAVRRTGEADLSVHLDSLYKRHMLELLPVKYRHCW
jgi:hypothetical protein